MKKEYIIPAVIDQVMYPLSSLCSWTDPNRPEGEGDDAQGNLAPGRLYI